MSYPTERFNVGLDDSVGKLICGRWSWSPLRPPWVRIWISEEVKVVAASWDAAEEKDQNNERIQFNSVAPTENSISFVSRVRYQATFTQP